MHLFAPQIAFYIDPGTGSMLVTVLIGLLTTGYFFFKRLWIKLKFMLSGGGAQAKQDHKFPYVIFSDHKRYWNVFKPVCDEFERRGIDLEYWTASSDDPALAGPYEHVHAEFIGEENKAFARLNMMAATICLSTTPGLDVLQWKRSPEVDWYVHTFHTVGTALGYRMFGMDYYDAILLAGPYQEDEIRTVEDARGIPHKELVTVGCTYLDENAKRYQCTPHAQNDRTVVLLAPSWGPNAILSVYGERILKSLLETGFEIIVRPHPQSQTSDKDILEHLMAAFPNSEDISWNFDNDNYDVLDRADVMITDFSGVVFDYTLIFDKPVIYTEGNYDDALYDAAWYDKPQWRFTIYSSFGIPLKEEDFPRMKDVIEQVMADDRLAAGREKARRDAWSYPGESAERTVDYLVQKYDEITSAKATQ